MLTEWLFDGVDDSRAALMDLSGKFRTYGELRRRIWRAADLLERRGHGPGALLAVNAGAPVDFLCTALAAWEVGAAVVPLDEKLPPAEAERFLERTGASGVAVGLDEEGMPLLHEGRHPRRVDPSVGLVVFTSGTSGAPKGVMLSAKGLEKNIEGILSYLPLRHCPRMPLMLPLTHGYALVGQVLATLKANGTVLLMQGLSTAKEQLAAMSKLEADGVNTVPSHLERLAEAAVELPESERPPLRYVASASARLDDEIVALTRKAFPKARLFNQYGLTEASPRVCAVSDLEVPFTKGSVGRPLPGVTVVAVSDALKTLPPGQEGILAVRGPSVMVGYLEGEGYGALTEDKTLLTGDWGYVDHAGYVYVRGRADDVVKSAGERVSLDEVAEALRRAAGVRDAHVVAVPDKLLGNKLVAFLECAVSSLPSVELHLAGALKPAQRPTELVAVEALPRTRTGKVAAEELRARVAKPSAHGA